MNGGGNGRKIAIAWLIVFIAALPVLGFGLKMQGAGDRLKGSAAVKAALNDQNIKTVVDAAGYDRTRVLALDEHTARVSFYAGQKVVLEAGVDPKGRITATQVIAPGYVRAGGRSIQSPLVLIGLTALFLLMFGTLPLRRLRNLDLLVLSSVTVTIWVLNQRLFELSIWLAIPILLYLVLRCFRIGFSTGSAGLAADNPLIDVVLAKVEWNSTTALKWAVGLAGVGAVALCIPGGSTGDVGVASLSGATQLIHGNLPYGNIASDIVHGDTYPIFAYLLYVPAAIFMPVRDVFDNADGALWISTISLLVAAYALFVAGRDAVDREFGLRNAFAWLVFPPVLITASSGSNDMTTAMFVAIAVASIAYAGRSTLALSLAAWAKVVPVLVLPLWIARFRADGWRRALVGPVVLTVAMLAVLLIYGGIDAVRDMLHGLAFQAGRGSVLSPWTVIDAPALHLICQAATVAAAFAAAYAVWQSPALASDMRKICGFAAGILLSVQLTANYWSYAYLPWAFPFLAVALLWPATTTRLPVSDGDPAPSAEVTDSGA
jgi:hypothetical protein